MDRQRELFPIDTPDPRPADSHSIGGLCYFPRLLSDVEQSRILGEIDAMPWRDDLKRRVQHYGYRYDYKARRVDQSMFLGPLPSFAIDVAERLLAKSLIKRMPDQVIVNEYLPGQGISPHVDCEPCFADTICTVSLGWAYEMDFISVDRPSDARSILLEPGSVLIMQGEARYEWRHQIKGRRSDRGIPRQRRVSLTFRNVLLDACTM